jgi:hypothetical protein
VASCMFFSGHPLLGAFVAASGIMEMQVRERTYEILSKMLTEVAEKAK